MRIPVHPLLMWRAGLDHGALLQPQQRSVYVNGARQFVTHLKTPAWRAMARGESTVGASADMNSDYMLAD